MTYKLELLIKNYSCAYPHEKGPHDMLSFYRTERKVFTKKKGHFTGSGWVVSPDKRKILMTHHKTINKWLQVALREATEESGLHRFEVLNKTIFDLDIHKIQKVGSDLSHFHYDVRFLLEADPEKEPIIVSKESYDVVSYWKCIKT